MQCSPSGKLWNTSTTYQTENCTLTRSPTRGTHCISRLASSSLSLVPCLTNLIFIMLRISVSVAAMGLAPGETCNNGFPTAPTATDVANDVIADPVLRNH